MGNANTRYVFRATAFGMVDAESGVISGVAVISEGPARGHFDWSSQKPLYVDAKTLEQVKACAETYKGGLKVKMDHFSGVTEIVGALRGFTPEGGVLRSDLHLLKTTRHREYIVELAQTIPDGFGLSISFSGPAEVIGDRAFARCVEIYSADLVSEPAANPGGLFEAKPATSAGDTPARNTQPNTTIMDETKLAAIQASLDALSARLEKLEKPAAPPAASPETPEQMQARITQVAELAAKNALTAFAATLGTAPGTASAPAPNPNSTQEQPKKFEELVRAHPKYSENKAFAVSDTVAKHPKEHAAYLDRIKGGEVILF